jgi:hypothetical protein
MTVIASEAKQSREHRAPYGPLDCFVASLLAMTGLLERTAGIPLTTFP